MMTTNDVIDRLRALAVDSRSAVPNLFAVGTPIEVARAPGRLDVMGGIADYSGSLVLEMPIAEAAFVALQAAPSETGLIIVSLPQQPSDPPRRVSISADEWSALRSASYEEVCERLKKKLAEAWVAYVVGPLLTMLHETHAQLPVGLRILLDSRVPEGKGVSSSAAVEVATLRAAAALANFPLQGEDVARLSQMAENHVVGAPCGIMDQMTSALGRKDQLLALRCQPANIEGYAAIPAGIAFWGIDSGIRHAVSGSDYSSVRTGAFMGYRIIAEMAGLKVIPAAGSSQNAIAIEDPNWGGYLANLTPSEFRERFVNAVPQQMTGREFLIRYGGITDVVTRVDPDRTYAVREPTFHPIGENSRVERFRDLLHAPQSADAIREMGELMFEAHASYSACRLGSDGTDLLVKLIRDRGPDRGLFGAKITGGGSGGTVCVLGRTDSDVAIDELAREYAQLSGRQPYVFRGSSPGACSEEVIRTTI